MEEKISKVFDDFKNHSINQSEAIRKVLNLCASKYSTESIEDGWGSCWSVVCGECGEKSMEVVRPGKVQCKFFG